MTIKKQLNRQSVENDFHVLLYRFVNLNVAKRPKGTFYALRIMLSCQNEFTDLKISMETRTGVNFPISQEALNSIFKSFNYGSCKSF